MLNFITNNAGAIANGAYHATNYALGRETGSQLASTVTGSVVGGTTEIAAAGVFGTLAEVAALGGATTLAGVGTAGVALAPAIATVAGTLAGVGVHTLFG